MSKQAGPPENTDVPLGEGMHAVSGGIVGNSPGAETTQMPSSLEMTRHHGKGVSPAAEPHTQYEQDTQYLVPLVWHKTGRTRRWW